MPKCNKKAAWQHTYYGIKYKKCKWCFTKKEEYGIVC